MGRRHPIFARVYGRLAPAMDRGGLTEYRKALLEGAGGRVLEVGAGAGSNFAHYPPQVTGVLALEPEPHLRRLARRAAGTASVQVQVQDGVAESLAADDESFDTVVACLMLCSVNDRAAALAEMYRVLRPGGRLHFFEHVRAGTPGLRRVQRALDATLWPTFSGGCHLSADTETAIERAGFGYVHIRHLTWPPGRVANPSSPHILGVALRP